MEEEGEEKEEIIDSIPPEREEDKRLTAGLAARTTATTISSSSVRRGDFPATKRRGRPRKYGPGCNMLMAASFNQREGASSSASPSPSPSPQLQRGRPPGAILASLGGILSITSGGNFTSQAIIINPGEDVVEKISCVCPGDDYGVFALSAIGLISSVALHQPTVPSTRTFEGPFEILSLTGIYTVSETDGGRPSGGLIVTLGCYDGSVLGGGVAGALIAASPVQAVIGVFVQCRSYNNSRLVPSPRSQAVLTSSSSGVVASAPIVMQEPSMPPWAVEGRNSGGVTPQTHIHTLNLNFRPPTSSSIQRPSPDVK